MKESNFPFAVIQYMGSVPSINTMYATNRFGKRRVSKKHRDFKIALAWIAKIKNVKMVFANKVELKICINFKRRGRDLDNILKPVIDALKGIIYNDDKQIFKITLIKTEDKNYPEELIIRAYEL